MKRIFFALSFFIVSFVFVSPTEAALSCSPTYGTPISNMEGTAYAKNCPSNIPVSNSKATAPTGFRCCMTQANSNKLDADFAKQSAAEGGACSTKPIDINTNCPTGTQQVKKSVPSSTLKCCEVVPPTTSESSTAASSGGSGGSTININVSNPLAYSTVEGALTGIMNAIKNIVVILAILMIVIGGIMYIFSLGSPDKMKTAKNVILAALVGLAIVIAAPSFLKEIYTLLGVGAEPEELAGAITLTQIARNVLNFLLSIIGTLAIIVMVISGIMYITSVGNETRMKTARQMFVAALIGITVSMASLILVTAVARFFI